MLHQFPSLVLVVGGQEHKVALGTEEAQEVEGLDPKHYGKGLV
mgnify:CR=1 FL=1